MREALPGMVSRQLFLGASQIRRFDEPQAAVFRQLGTPPSQCVDSLRVGANNLIDVPTQGTSSSQGATQTTEESTASLGMASDESTMVAICSHTSGFITGSSQASVQKTSSTGGRLAGRASRTPKRVGGQTTRLEAVDDSLGPLGPLGDSFVAAAQSEETLVESPVEQQIPIRASRPPASTSQAPVRTMRGDEGDEDENGDNISRPRVPPPVQPLVSDTPSRQVQPSVSVVEAAKPTFHITVGDPHKVGGATGAHTEYMVNTRVSSEIDETAHQKLTDLKQTTSKAYRNSEFTVSRRFRDFLWLYEQLHDNNPGLIVPPPPEKQAVGRFNVDFVESRRQSLERMLNKTAVHPTLQHDADLKLFLESESFHVDLKHRERKEPLVGESSKGMLSSIGIGGSGVKFVEHDDWFHDRKVYLDALESQLKALDKAVDTVVTQRKGLAEAAGDLSASLHSLANVELSPSLSSPLDGLSDLQVRIQELYQRQAQQDILTLGIVIDEYIRMIGSCKTAFNMRQKSYYGWHAAEADLAKKKTTQDKLLRQGRSQTDRLNQLSAEVADAEKRAHQARLLFEDMGRILRTELDRFEREKVEEFKSGVETYLETAVEAQKQVSGDIFCWSLTCADHNYS